MCWRCSQSLFSGGPSPFSLTPRLAPRVTFPTLVDSELLPPSHQSSLTPVALCLWASLSSWKTSDKRFPVSA